MEKLDDETADNNNCFPFIYKTHGASWNIFSDPISANQVLHAGLLNAVVAFVHKCGARCVGRAGRRRQLHPGFCGLPASSQGDAIR